MESPSGFQTSRILRRTGMAETIDFWQAGKDFLVHLNYTKGYSPRTCYNYNSDLGIWGRWLEAAGKDRRVLSHIDVKQFAGAGGPGPRREQAGELPVPFHKWAVKNSLVETDPVYLADKPTRPHRIPVCWRKGAGGPGRPRDAWTISPWNSSAASASTPRVCAGAMTSSSGPS